VLVIAVGMGEILSFPLRGRALRGNVFGALKRKAKKKRHGAAEVMN